MAEIRVVLKDIHGNSIVKQSGTAGALTHNDLEDVSITTPIYNQALVYNGNKWVNRNVDEEPVENSHNPIVSNAVYEGLEDIESIVDYIIKSENIITFPRVVNNGVLEYPTEPFVYKLPSSITTIKDYAFTYAFHRDALDGSTSIPQTITEFDANNVATIDGNFVFDCTFYNSDIATLNMSNLTTITGINTMNRLCYNCSNLTTVNFNNLESITGRGTFQEAFRNCTNLIELKMPHLTTITTRNYAIGSSSYDSGYIFSNCCYNCTSLKTVDFSNLTTIVETTESNNYSGVFSSAFYGCSNLETALFTNLKEFNGNIYYGNFNNIFYNCSKLTTVDFSNLEIINNGAAFENAFYNCTSLQTISFPKLKTLNHYRCFASAFYGCSNLETITFPLLTNVDGSSSQFRSAFSNCTKLTTISFPSLNHIDNSYYYNDQHFAYAFSNCSGLTDVYFPSIDENSFTSTNTGEGYCPFYNMLSGCSNVVVHFPANKPALKQILESWTNVLSGYGGSNCSTVYDL